ncbi:MAG: hypothetical protein KGM46_03140 [Pseudomonadota bacterium]|jgi:hypothetical protein|nr:hypothetical protein [Xanthomonadaceae bacterium]MDE2246947.1 hypothetical protein [Xanthomonadaceae bacterium]MDE3209714.1 hypothetical protein [Pseudomonadota bacterium]
MKSNRMARSIASVLIGLSAAGAATAAGQAPVAQAQSGTSVMVQGVQVAIDPRTGRLVAPTQAQRDELSRRMGQQAASGNPPARSAAGRSAPPRNELEARATEHRLRLANGHMATGIQVPESLMSDLVAERRADGSLAIHHQSDAPQAGTPEVTQ